MEPINVERVEFYPKENAKEHKTTEYDLVSSSDVPTPIFRRGFNFFFAVKFDRDFDPSTDALRVHFNFGQKPNVLKGTKVVLRVEAKNTVLPPEEDFKWAIALNRHDGDSVILQVHVPANAQVGIWWLSMQSNIKGQKQPRSNYKNEEDIYILFNPWCGSDGVYMENEEDLKEYVLNETGKIWCGTFKNPKGKRWIFGQFDDVVLPAACLLLEKSGLPHSERGSPVMITRAISAVVNSADDDGLLEGKWEGDFSDGTSPHAWTGSTAIMDQYLRTGGQPVKYGQCWVFSAVTVTVCRTLGIPCRSVTNYVSAHDTNCSLTVDKYFDVFGNKIENGPDGDCRDSCWNFHVWNDVWISRPDLPAGYGGWQIIDATPQELSDNVFRCGPASQLAVRRGEVGYLYDTPFVFAEVNADICHFQEDEDSDWGFSKLSMNRYHVGRKLITKNPQKEDDTGDSDLMDITTDYKNPEGTEAERLAVYNAVKGIPKAHQFYEIPMDIKRDVSFDLIDIDEIPFGESFDVVVKVENESEETRTVSAMISATSVYYTGASAHDIKKSQGTFSLESGQRKTLSIRVTPSDYLDKLVDHSLIKIYSIANVKETKQTWSEEDDFTLTKPQVSLVVDKKELVVNESATATFSFKNPLDMTLTECNYSLEGPGLQKPKLKEFRDVEPYEDIIFEETFNAKRPGARKIVVNFNCKQFQGVDGSVTVHVFE